MMRIHDKRKKGPLTLAEEFLLFIVIELGWATKNGHHGYRAWVFGLMKEYLYGSPERAMQMCLAELPEGHSA